MSHEFERSQPGTDLVLHTKGRLPEGLVEGTRALAELAEPISPHFDFQAEYERGYRGPTNPNGPYVVVCIDEGTEADAYAGTQGKGIIHSPGSGILFASEISQYLAEHPVEAVFSHKGCGAAGIYAVENQIDLPTDEVAIQQAKRLANSTGIPYAGDLILTGRPANFHPAKTIYYVADSGVEPSREPHLPPGFEISRWAWGLSAVRDVNLAMQIAHSASGLGERYFSPEKPLHLVGIASLADKEKVTGEVNAMALLSKYNKNIKTSMIVTKH